MHRRTLGAFGLRASSIGMGALPFTAFYGDQTTESTAIQIIHEAIDVGVNLIDTADIYGNGSNEELVGKAIAEKRDAIVVATKFGYVLNRPDEFGELVGRPEYVKQACEHSLRRLNIDEIDLYQQHRVDPNVPIEETVGAMHELVAEGKVRFLGLSEAQPEDIERATHVAPISTLQSEYSIFERAIEKDVLSTCESLGVSLIAYAPLGRGILTGKLGESHGTAAKLDRRRKGMFPRLQGENLAQNLKLAAEVQKMAVVRGITMAQLALAWLLHQKPWIVPIPGTDRIEYLRENAEAVDIGLTGDELARIDALIPQGGSAAGARVEGEQAPTAISPPLRDPP